MIPTATSPARPPRPNPATRLVMFPTTSPKKAILLGPTNSDAAIAKAKRAKARSVKEETHPFALFNIDMYTPHVC